MKTINDNGNLFYKLPKFIQKFFLKSYLNQGFVYINENNIPNHCGNKVQWLEEINVISYNEKRADKIAFNYFNDKYSKYKNYIKLF